MADAPAVRDRAGELVERGEKSSQQTKTNTPSLASVVAQWQQSIGNSNVAALSALADEQATAVPAPTTGAPAAAPVDAAPESPRPGVRTRARTPADVVQLDPGATTTPGSAAPVPSEPDEIAMPPMDVADERAAVTQAPPAPLPDRDAPSAPTGAPRLDEGRPDVSSRVGPPAAPPSAPASPSVAGPAAAPAGADAPAASPAAAARSRVDEFTKPGFTEKNQAAKGKPKLSARDRPTGSSGRPNRPPNRGDGGGAAAAKPSLGDPTLDKWKAAVAAGAADVKADDLTSLDDAASAVGKEGADRTAARQASLADPNIDAKSNQPPLPKEEPKQKALNTAEADSVIAAVEAAGTKRLTNQSFSPIGSPPTYVGGTLTGSDYVPTNLRSGLVVAALALFTTTDATVQAALFKKFNALKEQIAAIEATGGKGVGPEPPQPIQDNGPASLTPPNPVMGDVLGDAIARSMLSVDSRATQIHESAVRAVNGSKVRPMIEMGKAEAPALQRELRTELSGIATAAGVSKEQLDTRVIEQQAVVFKQILHAETGIQFEAAKAVAGRQGQAKDEGDAIAGAKTAVQQEISDKQAAAEGPPDTAAIEAKRDELLGKLTATAATVSAGWRASVTKRHAELDAGASEKQQKISALANTQAAAIRRHWANDPDPNKGMVEARPTVEWADVEATKVEAELNRLKAGATAEHDALVDGVNQQLTPGKDRIRDWAAHQEGRERGWWERLIDMFRDWGKQAMASNEAWERQRNAESRESMMQDLKVLGDVKQAQLDRSQDAYSTALGNLTREQQLLARTYLEGGVDSIGFVAESMMSRIAARRAPELAATFEPRAIAEWEWEDLGELARATNPGFQPTVLANKVHAGVVIAGTNEAKVYEGLGGARTAVERAALDKCYLDTFGSSMADDVDNDMDGEEWARAKALMSGNSAMADAVVIAGAVMIGDAQEIRDTLRNKTAGELAAIKQAYRDKYHVELVDQLRNGGGLAGIVGSMGGAERNNVLALADGDIDTADAAELEDAMAGPGTAEQRMTRVYERIREEEQKYALAHGLTRPEHDKRIKDRNARVAARFAAMGYGDLTATATDELSDGNALFANNADTKLFQALQGGDESKIDAAKALVEREGAYTSDDAVERIVRNQRTRAEFDVNLDEGAEKARLDALASSGDISREEYAAQPAALDPNDGTNRKRKEALTVSRGKANMAALKTEYGAMANIGGSTETFDRLIDTGTSGYSKDEINDLIDAGGKLTPEQEVYYSVAGAGTDLGKLKEMLKGKTPAEIDVLRSDYDTLHGRGSFDSDVLGDVSGRDDLDIGLTLVYGDPSTFVDQLAKAKPERRANLVAGFETYLRKRQDFERTGGFGAMMPPRDDSMNSLAQIERAVTRAREYHAALTVAEADPENKDKAIDVGGAKARFDMNFQGAVQAQDEVREQNDAFADIAAQVAAALVGIAVAFATAGTATLAMVALYSAVASAATSIVVKATLKGAAYGWEDLGIDVAVGLVDIAMSYATAGFGKVALAAVERAVLSQAARMAAKEGAGKLTESAVKAFIKEAVEEGIENGIQAMPSAFVAGVAEGQDLVTAAKGAGTAGLQSGGVGIGIHSGKAIGGAAATRIKRAFPNEPKVETGGPQAVVDEPRLDEPRLDEPHTVEPPTTVSEPSSGSDSPTSSVRSTTAIKPDDPSLSTREPATARGAASPDPDALPAGTIFYSEGVDALDTKANRDYFMKMAADDPGLEFALMRNIETGQYAVMKGDGSMVPIGDTREMVDAVPNQNVGGPSEGLRLGGKWVVEAHNHPIDASGVTPVYDRLPSGASGDMRAMVVEAKATGQARSSELHIVTERGPDVTKFGFDPNHEKPFMIDYPDAAGARVPERFATIDEYHEWYAKQHGKVASLGEVPDDFEGPRAQRSADFDVEEPTVPGGRRPTGTAARAPGHLQPIKQTLADASTRTVEDPNAATAVDPRSAASVYGGPEAHAQTVPPPLAATVEDPHAATAVDVRPAASVDAGSAALAETLPTRPADAASSISASTVDSVAEHSRFVDPGNGPVQARPTDTRWDDMALPEHAGGRVAPWQEIDPDAPNPLRPEGPLAEGQADWQALPAGESLKETPRGTFDDVGLPSVPRGAEFGEDQAAHFQIGAPPESGLSAATGSVIVTDERTGKQYLFKPESAEVYVRRAAARGIRPGEYAPRASAAAQVGQDLGLPTPNVTLVRIGNQRGSLTEWVHHGKTLKQIAQENPTLFMSIVNSPEYARLRAGIDAFDFLINNIDRNGGNLIAQLGSNNELLRLVPIDHDLAFTSTPERAVMRPYAHDMPTDFSEQTVRNLEQMSRNRQQLTEALGPLVGWEAIPGVMQRLDQLLAAANASAGR